MSTPLIFDRDLVRARRDRAASTFGSADFLLQHVMEDLLARLSIVQRSFRDILVLGSHTGMPGRLVREARPDASVIEADLSGAMCRLCDGPVRHVDEEFLPFPPESLDCVIAPLTLQFVNDLPGALLQIRRALRPDGLLLGAMLGGDTLAELSEAFAVAEADLRGGASPRVAPRVDVRTLGGLLQRAGFTLPVADTDPLTVTYPTALDLMRDLRAMAATNAMVERSRIPVTRGLLMKVAEVYAERFGLPDGRIPATFEIITMTAWSPHPDQPKPLRPGSASHRLADVLGSAEHSAGEKVPDHQPDRSDKRNDPKR